MAGKTVDTQEGSVPISRGMNVPTVVPPVTTEVQEVAYSSPYQEKLAKEEAARLAGAAKEIFRGPDWSDLPNFYCPFCAFASLDGDAAVLAHGAFRHPGVDLVTAVMEKKEHTTDG